MHYGYDNCPATGRSGTLHFYNNTVIHDVSSSQVYNTSIFDISPAGTVNARNNAIIHTGTTNLNMAYHSKSTSTGTYNWLGGNYVSRPYQDVRTGYTAAAWNETNSIIDGNVTSGVIVDAANNDARVASGSPLISAGVSLPSDYTDNGYGVDKQYKDARTFSARANTNDIGAYLYGSTVATGKRYANAASISQE